MLNSFIIQIFPTMNIQFGFNEPKSLLLTTSQCCTSYSTRRMDMEWEKEQLSSNHWLLIIVFYDCRENKKKTQQTFQKVQNIVQYETWTLKSIQMQTELYSVCYSICGFLIERAFFITRTKKVREHKWIEKNNHFAELQW